MPLTIYMAPIRGITNCVYRNTYSRLFKGYDLAIAPFLKNCNVTNHKHKLLRDLFPERNDLPYELIPQLLTKRPPDFIRACKHLHTLGYKTVNWNLGCPHKRVRSRLHGSGMLAHTDKLLNILDEVLPHIKNKISLKVRLGSTDKSELLKLMPRFDAYPIKEIIIHPRTGAQMYQGECDLNAFGECLTMTKHKIVFNGDIESLKTFHSLQKRFPEIDTWMIGRGGIINPFLIEEIKTGKREPDAVRLKRYKSFHDKMLEVYSLELSGWSHKAAKLKEYWYYWSQAFEEGKHILYEISRTQKEKEYKDIVASFFSRNPHFVIE